MKNQGISIIIPCYNSGNYILEAVKSVLEQPFKCKNELIIIDDCSNDLETIKSLDSLSNEPKISIYKLSVNQGAQYARNVGINKAKYDYILTMDADDRLNLDSDVLEYGTYADNAIEILEDSKDIAFVHSINEMFDQYSGFTISTYPVTQKQILQKHHAQTSIIYRKSDALEAGGYSENILKWQDWSFAVSLLNTRFKQKKENKIHFFEIPYYLYRVHNNPNRISYRKSNERDMIKMTVEENTEIFFDYYRSKKINAIVDEIYKSKPDKLTDLLFIAANNIEIALNIAKQRGYKLSANIDPTTIP